MACLDATTAMHGFVVKFFQFKFVRGLFTGKKLEQVADGSLGRGQREFLIVAHGGVFTPHGILQDGLIVRMVTQVGQMQTV